MNTEDFEVDPALLNDAEDEKKVVVAKKTAVKTKGRKKRKGTPVKRGKALQKVRGKSGKPRKPHRFRPGTVALRDIRRLQKSTDNQFRKAPFQRLIRELVADATQDDLRIQKTAFLALQCAAEDAVVEMISTAYAASAIESGRVTLLPKDLRCWAKMTKTPLGDAACQAMGIARQ